MTVEVTQGRRTRETRSLRREADVLHFYPYESALLHPRAAEALALAAAPLPDGERGVRNRRTGDPAPPPEPV